MKKRTDVTYWIIAAVALFSWGCSGEESADPDYAIENVAIVSMADEQVQEDRTILVDEGIITDIVETGAVALPENVNRIDGNGRYIIPGLAEMHAHIPSGNEEREYIEDILFLYLANGITTIRGMLGDELHLDLREQAANNELESPTIYTAGPGFGGNDVDSPEHARERVREQHEAGYDFLKIFPGLTVEEYEALAEEANEVGIEFSGHVPPSVGLAGALEAGQTTVDHLDSYVVALASDTVDMDQVEDPGVIYFGMHMTPYVDSTKITEIARQTREAGTWNVPTQALSEHVLGVDDPESFVENPEFQYLPEEMVEDWLESQQSIRNHEAVTDELIEDYLQLRRDIVKALHDEGAGLLLGSDAPQIFNVPGFSMHHELRYLMEAGLSPYEALRTGTYEVARYLDNMENAGTVEEGKVADLVMLNANPLEDIENSSDIAGVMYRGNWLSGEEIEERLREIADKQ
ncbi:MAG: amidohydrolase family protein [Balneolaceae bacterium]